MPGRRSTKPIPPGLPQDDPRDLYVQRGVSLEDLARILKGRRGCSIGHLKRRSSREEWPKQRDQWEAETRQAADSRAAVSEADQRLKRLARIRRVEDGAAAALEKLMPGLEDGTGLLGEKQGRVTALKELAHTMALAGEAAAELVDDRDDRFAQVLAAAEEIAGTELTDVTDLNTDEELMEAMTVRGLDDLAVSMKPKVDTEAGEGGSAPA